MQFQKTKPQLAVKFAGNGTFIRGTGRGGANGMGVRGTVICKDQ